MKTVRTRLAPSPTGYLHIANLQKIIFSYALAKKHGGQYILRIEDTDRNRFVEGAEHYVFDAHELLGIPIDESVIHGGNFGPYRQSDRLEIYNKYALELIEGGYAYYAFETKEELDEMRAAQSEAGHRPHYNGQYRDYPLEEAQKRVAAGELHVIRLKVPKNEEIKVQDLIMGELKFNTNDVDDYILVKSDGFPTYHLAVVVDDHLMEISHVFRGVEWIPTTPVIYLLYKAFGWEMPEIGHVPNILNHVGKGKLGKRHGSVALAEFFEKGYLKEAIINYIGLLGWTPPIKREHGEKEREIFSLEEIVELFDTKDLNKSNPKFNPDKLLWFNKEYIKSMDNSELTERFKWWVEKYGTDLEFREEMLNDSEFDKKIALVSQRANLLSEIPEMLTFFYSAPGVIDWNVKQMNTINEKDGLRSKLQNDILELMSSLNDDSDSWTHEEWENGMRAIGDKNEVKHGDVFMVLRLMIVGGTFSPPLFECLQILGKDEVVARIQKSI